MFAWIKKKLKAWAEAEPYHIDTCKKSKDGTPILVLYTPRKFGEGSWRLETTSEGQQASVIAFGIRQDIGRYKELAIDALEGRLDNIFTQDCLDVIAEYVGKVVHDKNYTAFRHNGKPHLEFVTRSLSKEDIKRLKNALECYKKLIPTNKKSCKLST